MNNTTQLSEVISFLNGELRISEYQDNALNGLQVESGRKEVSRVGFAVDAGYSVIQEAVKRSCQLLVVHHGLFWGKCEAVVGPLARKLQACLSNNLSMYAAHLPLDGHPVLGNAAQIAQQLLGIKEISPAFEYQGSPIGVSADLSTSMQLSSIAQRLTECPGALSKPLVLPFGKSEVRRVGIATGAATFMIPEAVRLGLDVFITGEPKQEAYHVAKELGMSVICMGHYASETFGVRALQRVLAERFGVDSEWIDEPTGI